MPLVSKKQFKDFSPHNNKKMEMMGSFVWDSDRFNMTPAQIDTKS